jgi:hypothetical protein
MADCFGFSNDFTNSDGKPYKVYYGDFIPLEECGDSPTDTVVMSPIEYVELKAQAGQLTTYEGLLDFIDPLEVSATFGTCFALMVFLGFVGYKVKVAKSIINQV